MADQEHNQEKGKNPPGDNSLDFEQSLLQLENLVNRMEKGDLSLEESLQAFEQGIKLTRDCQATLNSAEQRVQFLIEEKGSLVATSPDIDDHST